MCNLACAQWSVQYAVRGSLHTCAAHTSIVHSTALSVQCTLHTMCAADDTPRTSRAPSTPVLCTAHCAGHTAHPGIRTHRHRTHQLTKPGFLDYGRLGANGGKWLKVGGNGEKWGGMGGNWEISDIVHGMWVVEGCGRMWLRKLRRKWMKNGRKTGRNTHFSQSHFPRCSGGRRSSLQFPLGKISSLLVNGKM